MCFKTYLNHLTPDFKNLISDIQVLLSHRALAALQGVVLKLPPAKQVITSQPFKSGYPEGLIRRQK